MHFLRNLALLGTSDFSGMDFQWGGVGTASLLASFSARTFFCKVAKQTARLWRKDCMAVLSFVDGQACGGQALCCQCALELGCAVTTSTMGSYWLASLPRYQCSGYYFLGVWCISRVPPCSSTSV